jgi:mandelate racemase
VRRGSKAIKAKIGYPELKEDLQVVRAMRKAVGNDVAIMVDYNQSLTPSEAAQRLRVLDDEGLTWVEEPTLAHDYQGNAMIAREAKVPIQCGENW